MNRTLTPPYSKIKMFEVPDIKKHVLKNNIPVYEINAGTQDVVKIDFIFNAGIRFQPKPIVASFTAGLLSEGSKKFSSAEISESMDFHGSYIQGHSELDKSVVGLITLNKHLHKTIEVVEDIIKNPLFIEEEFKIYRNKKTQSFQLDSEKNKVLARRMFQEILFGTKHPYANKLELSDFDNITTANLKDFHKQKYCSNNCTIIIAGKTSEKHIKTLENHFGNSDWEIDYKSNLFHVDIQDNPQNKHYIKKPKSIQSAIRIGKITINKTHSDFLKLKVANTILGGYFGSRLMSNIREDKGYTYGIGSALVSFEQSGYFVIVTEVDTKYTNETLKEIYYELNRLCTEEVNENELARVRNYLLGDLLGNYDGPFSLSESYRGIIEYNLEKSYFDLEYKTIDTITAKEIKEIFNKYLHPNSMHEVIAGIK